MNDLSPIDTADLLSRPSLLRPAAEQAAYAARLAAKTTDWPELRLAVDVLIQRQRAIVQWWDNNVRPAGHQPNNADPTLIGIEEARQTIGFRQDQISRFRSALADEDAYRERLVRRCMREAGLIDKDPNSHRPTPDREGPDFWPTPISLIDAFIARVLPQLPNHKVWECAAGDGRLGYAIRQAGRGIVMTDKYTQSTEIRELDFLADGPPEAHLIATTNPPYSLTDEFIERGLILLDRRAILGFALLLRHDHFQAGSRIEAFNRATFEVHCNWRPIWIEGTDGAPRWAFAWMVWLDAARLPPLYLARED
jgi:hypothetical protein